MLQFSIIFSVVKEVYGDIKKTVISDLNEHLTLHSDFRKMTMKAKETVKSFINHLAFIQFN